MIEAYCVLPTGDSRVVFVADRPPGDLLVSVMVGGSRVRLGIVGPPLHRDRITLHGHWHEYGDGSRRFFYCESN